MSKSGFAAFLSCGCLPVEIIAVAATRHTKANKLNILRIEPPYERTLKGPTGRVTANSMPIEKSKQQFAYASAAAVRPRILPLELLYVKLFRRQKTCPFFLRNCSPIALICCISAPLAQTPQE